MAGSVCPELWEIVERGLWKWSISLYGCSVRGTWRGGSFTGDPEGYVEESLVRGIAFHRGPIKEPGRRFMYPGLWETDEGYVEKALETGISLHRGPAGEPGRGLIYQGLWEMDEGGPRSRASLFEGTLWGELEGGLLYWGPWRMCKERLWKWASLSKEALWGEPGWRVSLLGTPKDMVSMCPASGELGGCSFPGAFERREKFLYTGKFLWGIWEICKKRPCVWAAP